MGWVCRYAQRDNKWSVLPNRLTPVYSEIHYEVRTIYGRDSGPLNTAPDSIVKCSVRRYVDTSVRRHVPTYSRTHVLSFESRYSLTPLHMIPPALCRRPVSASPPLVSGIPA